MFMPSITFVDVSREKSKLDPGKAEELILAIIFRHLQMFQYYRDLKEYDKNIESLWNDIPEKANEKLKSNSLDHEFLRKWTEDFGINKEDGSKIKQVTIKQWSEHEFIEEFRICSRNSESSSKKHSEEFSEKHKKVYFILQIY